MRLLLDESVPSRRHRSLTEHSVRTVVETGWSGIKNGKLLALAANEVDAFITVDKNLPFQQNLATLPIALVVLDSVSNELRHYGDLCLLCYASSRHYAPSPTHWSSDPNNCLERS